MATVVGKTSQRIDELLGKLLIQAVVDSNGNVVTTTRDGTVSNVGKIVLPSELELASTSAAEYADQQIQIVAGALAGDISTAETNAKQYADQQIQVVANAVIARQEGWVDAQTSMPNDGITRTVYSATVNFSSTVKRLHVAIDALGFCPNGNAACHWSLHVSVDGGSTYTALVPDARRHNNGLAGLPLSAALQGWVHTNGATSAIVVVNCVVDSGSSGWLHTGHTSYTVTQFG